MTLSTAKERDTAMLGRVAQNWKQRPAKRTPADVVDVVSRCDNFSVLTNYDAATGAIVSQVFIGVVGALDASSLLRALTSSADSQT